MPTRSLRIRLAVAILLVFVNRVESRQREQSKSRPHIVILMADDLGWNDVGYHGSEIATPNIDRLAERGVRLNQFYVQHVCSPTRASLMTGRYPMRMGLQVHVIRPWAESGVPTEERFLPEALREAGYETAITGKWHLGNHAPEALPTRRGFDRQYGHYLGNIDYFTHMREGGLDWHRDDRALREEGYSTTLIGREAARLIEEHDSATPMFLFVAFNAPHTPLQAPDEYIERYAGIEDPKRRIYAAMVACMDDEIGRVLGALEAKGMTDETLVFFSSDNGGPTNQGARNHPLRGAKGSFYEGGVRVPAVALWPGHLDAGTEVSEMIHIVDLYPTLLGLAGASADQPLPIDGFDIWTTLAEGRPSPRREILHNVEPRRAAIRRGDWKLILDGGGRRDEPMALDKMKAKLFNIARDPNEMADLANERPDLVAELLARLNAYRAQAAAPTGRYDYPPPEGYVYPKVWGEFE